MSWREKIQALVYGAALFDEPMSRHTSLGVGGLADALVFPRGKEELRNTLAYLVQAGLPYLPLGYGTNLIVRDGGYRGVIVGLKNLKRLVVEQEGDKTVFRAEAGVPLAVLLDKSLREGLAGLEFCAGMPGSVGGAVRMNAGAYGCEIKDVVRKVVFLTKAAEIIKRSREELNFSYRALEISPQDIVIEAAFYLRSANEEESRPLVEKILAQRKEKHPLTYRNAGSVFKNPEGAPAGRIIEELGLKGICRGGAQISEKHGNFIVNLGGAKAADVLGLIDLVKAKVLEEKGISLETEVCIVGEEA